MFVFKPCPCCGSQVVIQRFFYPIPASSDKQLVYRVICPKCDIQLVLEPEKDLSQDNCLKILESAWNCRTKDINKFLGELKICPCCGSKADYLFSKNGKNEDHTVICSKCGLQHYGNTKKEVFSAWNNRTKINCEICFEKYNGCPKDRNLSKISLKNNKLKRLNK